MTSEETIDTNLDALVSKYNACKKGYFQDEYIKYFIDKEPPSTSPEMNMGSAIRVLAFRNYAKSFVTKYNKKCQIINIGCGFDTLFMELHKCNLLPENGYFEIDFPSVTTKKIKKIKESPIIGILEDTEDICMGKYEASMHSKYYTIIGANLVDFSLIMDLLRGHKFNDELPTLVMAECVFMYLKPDTIQLIMDEMSTNLLKCVLLTLDPIFMEDPFSETMLSNLRQRNLDLYGYDYCIWRGRREIKFIERNWESVATFIMREVFEAMEPDVIEQIKKTEWLDEVNLFTDLVNHYAFQISTQGVKKNEFYDISLWNSTK